MTKNEAKKYNSTRGGWGGLNPVTRVVEDKTKYNRKKSKQDWKKMAKGEM